jgi:hypothetical protein
MDVGIGGGGLISALGFKVQPWGPNFALRSENKNWPLDPPFQELSASSFQWKIRFGVGLVFGGVLGGLLFAFSRFA